MVELNDVLAVVRDVQNLFEREIEQGLRNRNLDSAMHALAGKDACLRITNHLSGRFGSAIRVHTLHTGRGSRATGHDNGSR